MESIILWNMFPAFLRPKGRRRNSNMPKGVMIAVLQMSSSAIVTWYYPFCESSLEKTVEPAILDEKSAMLGYG